MANLSRYRRPDAGRVAKISLNTCARESRAHGSETIPARAAPVLRVGKPVPVPAEPREAAEELQVRAPLTVLAMDGTGFLAVLHPESLRLPRFGGRRCIPFRGLSPQEHGTEYLV